MKDIRDQLVAAALVALARALGRAANYAIRRLLDIRDTLQDRLERLAPGYADRVYGAFEEEIMNNLAELSKRFP